MAITGKQWSATLNSAYVNEGVFVRTLYYDSSATSPDEVASLYPDLSWDQTVRWSVTAQLHNFLGQFGDDGHGTYALREDAILDLTCYEMTDSGGRPGNGKSGGRFIRFLDGVWSGPNTTYGGTPGQVWAHYPDSPLYADTTPAPFGSGLGNGLIRYQVAYWAVPNNTDYLGSYETYSTPYPSGPGGNTGDVYIRVTDMTYIFTPIDDGSGSGGSVSDGGGDGTNATDALTLRSWGFKLDGHRFYVLQLGDSGTLVYDLSTKTWSEWETPGRTNWRAHTGQNWIGYTGNISGFSGGYVDVFAGDDATGTIWQLNVELGRDDRSDQSLQSSDKFTRIVIGGVQATGRESIPCGAVQLDIALGAPTQTGASIGLDFSDDLGKTWVSCDPVEIVADDFTAIVEFRGLGTINQPGRLFRLTDDGATVRIGRASMR